ncbi:MAG: MFS transporter, partial [Actinomycetota bacterium]|nr:MFS transporter [Actinomycetota bacterium]
MKRALIALAAGLVLADAAVVTLALPQVLLELDTSVEGVAAVIAIYTGVLALALPVSAALHGRATGAAGALLFAVASIGCASASSLELLLVMRALQALGGAALLAAAFDALDGGRAGRRLWVGAAVAGTAAGPALGGALTELFDWRAIFIAQAPAAALAAAAVLAVPHGSFREVTDESGARNEIGPVTANVALLLLSAGLIGALFLIVVLLINVWLLSPATAAAVVSAIPVATVLVERAARGRSPTLV